MSERQTTTIQFDALDQSLRRFPGRSFVWRGCPAAVKWEGCWAPYGGYRRCSGVVPDGKAACWVHDPSFVSRPADTTRRAIAIARRNGVRSLQELRWLRDDQILKMRNVGTALAAILIEARDAWDDERVRAEFGFPQPSVGAGGPDALAQWPDVLRLVGG